MWATSIGSTFVHSPVPGERKSGIPDGTEIPAPVSATTEPARADQLGQAQRPAPWPGVAHLPSNRGPRFCRKAEIPSLGVAGAEHGGERLLLGLDPGVEVAGRRHPLDLLDRQRRLAGQLAGPRQRGVEQLVVGHHTGGQPQLVGLVGADRVAGQVQLERLGLPHQSRQPLGAAEAGDDAEVDLGLAEGGRLGGDPEVAAPWPARSRRRRPAR